MKRAAVPSILVTVVLLAVGVMAEAQQPKKVPRMGYLSEVDRATDSARTEAIRLALRELGYIEGQNIAIEYRYADGKNDRLPELAAELVRLKVDIIVVAGGGTWVREAKNATKTIPIVMVGPGADPVKAGIVESLARPGGNVTGLRPFPQNRARPRPSTERLHGHHPNQGRTRLPAGVRRLSWSGRIHPMAAEVSGIAIESLN